MRNTMPSRPFLAICSVVFMIDLVLIVSIYLSCHKSFRRFHLAHCLSVPLSRCVEKSGCNTYQCTHTDTGLCGNSWVYVSRSIPFYLPPQLWILFSLPVTVMKAVSIIMSQHSADLVNTVNASDYLANSISLIIYSWT